MITYTVEIEQLTENRCAVHFKTVRKDETQAELADATIVAEHLRQVSQEISERYAEIGSVSVVDTDPSSGIDVDDLKDEIRRRNEGRHDRN